MAAPALTQIPGIGPHTASLLEEAGFDSVASIARADVEALLPVPGFGSARAATVIEAAASLTNEPIAPPEAVAEEAPAGTRDAGEKKPKVTARKKPKQGKSETRKQRKELKKRRKELLSLLSDAAERLNKAKKRKKRKKLKAHIADLESKLSKTERKLRKLD